MGKSITGKTLVTRVYTDEAKLYGLKTSAMLPSYKVLFGFNWADDATYTRPLRKIGEGFRIQCGGQMAAKMADVPDRIWMTSRIHDIACNLPSFCCNHGSLSVGG